MKKKILFVINSLGCGGAEKSLVSLLSLMDYQRYDVDLLMFNPGGMFMSLLPQAVHVLPQPAYLRYCANGGFSLRYAATRLRTSVGIRLHPKCKGRPLHDAQAYWKYASAAFDPLPEQYDVAIAWGQGNPTHFVAEKVTAGTKIAFINTNYEGVGHNKDFDRPYYAKFDHIAAVSDVLRQLIVQVFPEFADRISTVYDIRNQKLMEQMAEAYQPFAKQANTPVLVTVGRMVKQKGYDLAVAACKELQQRGVNFHWYFVGDGPEMIQVRKQLIAYHLEGCLFPVGAKENPYPYIKNADIYVQTSRFEGFCLTLAEARALHIPPVSTNFDVVYNQLCDGENGLIVDMTPKAIADGIERLLQDKALYGKIADTLKNEHIGNEEEIEKFYQLVEGWHFPP